MGRKRILKKKELLDAIKGSYGIISTIAGRLHWGDVPQHCANYAKNVLWMLNNMEQEQLWD